MQRGAVVLITMAGIMLFIHRPLTKGELDTIRVRLQVKIEAVEKKIDKLSRQVQTLNEKMDRLDRRFTVLQEYFDVGQRQNSSQQRPSPKQDPTESMEKVIPPKFDQLKEKRVHPSEVVH
ncbi:MAG: hypothetical protein ACE5NM_01750 [Sedimentisphaerales bacterium]